MNTMKMFLHLFLSICFLSSCSDSSSVKENIINNIPDWEIVQQLEDNETSTQVILPKELNTNKAKIDTVNNILEQVIIEPLEDIKSNVIHNFPEINTQIKFPSEYGMIQLTNDTISIPTFRYSWEKPITESEIFFKGVNFSLYIEDAKSFIDRINNLDFRFIIPDNEKIARNTLIEMLKNPEQYIEINDDICKTIHLAALWWARKCFIPKIEEINWNIYFSYLLFSWYWDWWLRKIFFTFQDDKFIKIELPLQKHYQHEVIVDDEKIDEWLYWNHHGINWENFEDTKKENLYIDSEKLQQTTNTVLKFLKSIEITTLSQETFISNEKNLNEYFHSIDILKETDDVKILPEYAKSNYNYLRNLVAKNIYTPSQVLIEMYESESQQDVLESIKYNPNTPEKISNNIHERDGL